METQLTNLLQSLFETDGERIYKTPTFYVMKLLRPHTGQYLIDVLPDEVDADLDTVATISEDGDNMTVSIVNRHLYDTKTVSLGSAVSGLEMTDARIVTAEDVRAYNTYDEPERITDKEFPIDSMENIEVPPHSVLRICFAKK